MESVFNLTVVCFIIRHLVRLVWIKLAVIFLSLVFTLVFGIIVVVNLLLSFLGFLLLFDLSATASLDHQHLTFRELLEMLQVSVSEADYVLKE